MHKSPEFLIFLHGRGSDEHSVTSIAPAFPDVTSLAPRGPLREGSGYAWFRNQSVGIADQESLKTQVQATATWIDHKIPSLVRPWLCGFSNGAAMAGALVLDQPRRYKGVVMICGPLVSERPWRRGMLKDVPILLLRGDHDLVIPPAIMLETVKYLESDSGASATIANFQGGHEIDAEALSIMHRWFIAHSTAPLNP